MRTRIAPSRRRWRQEVYDRAQALYNERPTPTPAQLTEQLSKEAMTLGVTPGESSVRDWIKNGWITLNPQDGPWSLADSTPDDAVLVLSFVKFLAEEAQDVTRRPSRAMADWVVKIWRIRPDLEPSIVRELAAAALKGGKHDLPGVERYLAGLPGGFRLSMEEDS